MPRNATGVYTLPQAAFQPNTVIASAAMNSNLSDIATALTQSLATTGVTPMTGQFLATSGAVGAPGVSFSSGTSTGMYLAGTNQIGFATNGTLALTINSDQSINSDGTLIVNGAATFNGTTYTFGSGAANAFLTGLGQGINIQGFVDGGGGIILANTTVWIMVPCACTINSLTLTSDVSGNGGVWVGFSSSQSSWTGTGGVSSISGLAYPTPNLALSSTTQNQLTNLSGWTTNLVAGNIITFFFGGNSSVNANATTITKMNATLAVTRTGQ